MPRKQKNGYYVSSVTPAPGVKPIWYRAKTLAGFRAERERIIAEYKTGRPIQEATFLSMMDQWYEKIKLPRVRSASSRARYETMRNRLYRVIPESKLARAMRYSDLQAIVDTFAGECQDTIDKVVTILRSVCDFAVQEGAMEFNPATSLLKPIASESKKRSALTDDQAGKLRSAALADPDGLPVLCCYYLGLRIGEALALRWMDVDLDRRRVIIRSAMVAHNPIGSRMGNLKTKGSERKIPIPDELFVILASRRGLPFAHLCPATSAGTAVDQVTFRIRWQRIMTAAGLVHDDVHTVQRKKKKAETVSRICPDFSPHWLRHNYATACYCAGIPISVAMAWLGHTEMKTTTDTYADIRLALSGDVQLDSHLPVSLEKLAKNLQIREVAW